MIPLFAVHMPDTVDRPLLETLHSGYLTEGPKVKEFERKLADFLINRRVLALNSGTSALHLALRLAGVGGGTEVIASPMTCTATIVPICAVGARIVWADVDPTTGNIDVEDVARKWGRNVKAVVAVDWGGSPIDVHGLRDATDGRSLIIEDAAHAFGATRSLVHVGVEADYTAFSFQAIKHITTGDGGALAVRSEIDYDRGKRLRWFGLDREFKGDLDNRVGQPLEEWGYKFHMNDIAAAIGIEQMKYVDSILAKHRSHAYRYAQYLDARFMRPRFNAGHAYWLYTVQLPNGRLRRMFMEHMAENGIATSQVHGRCDTLSGFHRYAGMANLPGVTLFSQRQVSIPVHWKLSEDDLSHIIDHANEFAQENL